MKKILILAALSLVVAQTVAVRAYQQQPGYAGLSYDDGRVETVFAGYPAEAAGMLPGDSVTAIDGVPPDSVPSPVKGDVRVFSVERDDQASDHSVTYRGHSTSYLLGALVPGFASVSMFVLGMIAFLQLGSSLSFLLAVSWLAMGVAGLNGEALPGGVWEPLNATLPSLGLAALVHFIVRFCHPHAERARKWILLSYGLGLILAANGLARIYLASSALTGALQSAVPFVAFALASIAAVSLFQHWRANSSQARHSAGLKFLLACPVVAVSAIVAAGAFGSWGQYLGMALFVVIPLLTSLALTRRDLLQKGV